MKIEAFIQKVWYRNVGERTKQQDKRYKIETLIKGIGKERKLSELGIP